MDISLPSAYEVTDDGTDDGYKRPTKPITEWTKEELDKYLANLDKRREKRIEAFSKLSPEEQAAVLLAKTTGDQKKKIVENDLQRLKVKKHNAELDKSIADFDKNLEKHLEAFSKLSPEEMAVALAQGKAQIDQDFSNLQSEYQRLDPESQELFREGMEDYERLVREEENFDVEAFIASSPEMQEMIKKRQEDARQLDVRMAEMRQFHEKVKNRVTSLLYEAEEKGAILIYDENRRPVGYEKDEYGDPVLIPVDEDTPTSDTSPEIPPVSQDHANLRTQEDSNPVALEPSPLADRVTDLWIKSYEEYPETVLVQMLSKEEYNLFFQDEDSKKWLSSRQQQMQKDVVSAVRKMLSSKSSEKEIEIVKKNITRFWDKDFAETIIQQVKKDRE